MSFISHLLNLTVADTVATTIPPTQSHSIPICAEAQQNFNCNADWLSRILGYPIESFHIKPVTGGFTTQSYRINFTTSQENVEETSVFLKYIIMENDRPFISRVISYFANLPLELLSRKEVFFYNHLRDSFNNHGIKTPRPLYIALEGSVSMILDILGFQCDLRGVICLQDLGQCENFSLRNRIPEKYAFYLSTKLAQLHALNWYQPIHPDFPSEFKPDAYIHFFQLPQGILTRNPNPKETIQRLNWWKNDCAFLNEPQIRNALMTFSEHKDILLKYCTNDKLTSGPLFQCRTFLHGDFHSGNILFKTVPSQEDAESKDIKEAFLVDWQCFGYGHPSTEFSYFLANAELEADGDLKIMKRYYEELTITVKPEEYPWEVFQREVEIRNLQIVMVSFNMFFSKTPEELKKMMEYLVDKRGMGLVDMDFYISGLRNKYFRFAYTMDKWIKENILERIEEF